MKQLFLYCLLYTSRDVVDEGSLEGAGKNLFLVGEECLYAFVLQFAYYAGSLFYHPVSYTHLPMYETVLIVSSASSEGDA